MAVLITRINVEIHLFGTAPGHDLNSRLPEFEATVPPAVMQMKPDEPPEAG